MSHAEPLSAAHRQRLAPPSADIEGGNMRGLRKYLVTAALAGGLALASAWGATGSAAAAPAQPNTTGVMSQSAPAQELAPASTLAWSCGSWTEVLPPGIWGMSCRNSAPEQGAGEAYNGRSYDVRLRITVKSRTPFGDVNLGSCDGWVTPGNYFWCGDFYLGAGVNQYPVVAFFQQLQP
jgi:hypothetical protein